MKDNHSKKADQFLSESTQGLQPLLAKINRLKQLNEKILIYIDEPMRSLCQIANIVDQKVTVLTANASVATELRLHARDLLDKIKKDPSLKDIKELQFKVKAHYNTPRSKRQKITKVTPISKQSAETIRDIAASIDDEKLRAIMLKIASHTDSEK